MTRPSHATQRPEHSLHQRCLRSLSIIDEYVLFTPEQKALYDAVEASQNGEIWDDASYNETLFQGVVARLNQHHEANSKYFTIRDRMSALPAARMPHPDYI